MGKGSSLIRSLLSWILVLFLIPSVTCGNNEKIY